jgi:hypothetical protein
MKREWPIDDVVRALPPMTRETDWRERLELVLGTFGGRVCALAVRKHPGSGDMTLAIEPRRVAT